MNHLSEGEGCGISTYTTFKHQFQAFFPFSRLGLASILHATIWVDPNREVWLSFATHHRRPLPGWLPNKHCTRRCITRLQSLGFSDVGCGQSCIRVCWSWSSEVCVCKLFRDLMVARSTLNGGVGKNSSFFFEVFDFGKFCNFFFVLTVFFF